MAEKMTRNSNLELLRIVAMLAIIGHHFFTQTAVFSAPVNTLSYFSAAILGAFGRSGVNIFVIIGAWFLVDMPFKSMRFFRLYLTCFVYTVLVTGVTLLVYPVGAAEAYKSVLRALTPFSSSPLWFISDYLLLLLLTPFLNTLLHALPRKTYAILCWILIVVFVVIPTVESVIPGFDIWEYYVVKSDMSWLVALYLLVGYTKRFPLTRMESGKIAGSLLGLLVFGVVFFSFIDSFCRKLIPSGFLIKKMHAFLEYLSLDISSAFCFLFAFSMFYVFRRLSFSSAVVNRISRNILGIYIVHQVPVFFPHMWTWFRVDAWLKSPLFPLYEIAVILTIFICGWCIDCVRETAMNPLLKSTALARLSGKWDDCFRVS